jgi:hypothetical protein
LPRAFLTPLIRDGLVLEAPDDIDVVLVTELLGAASCSLPAAAWEGVCAAPDVALLPPLLSALLSLPEPLTVAEEPVEADELSGTGDKVGSLLLVEASRSGREVFWESVEDFEAAGAVEETCGFIITKQKQKTVTIISEGMAKNSGFRWVFCILSWT